MQRRDFLRCATTASIAAVAVPLAISGAAAATTPAHSAFAEINAAVLAGKGEIAAQLAAGAMSAAHGWVVPADGDWNFAYGKVWIDGKEQKPI